MSMWLMIMCVTLVFAGSSLLYLSDRVSHFGFVAKLIKTGRFKQISLGALIVFLSFLLIGWRLNFINAIVCAIYFAFSWLISDLFFWIIAKIRRTPFKRYYAGGVAVIIALLSLSCGWYLAHNVWKSEYNLTTKKDVKNLKILMFADSHVDNTFDAAGFAEHVAEMQKQNPDIVIVAGDFVDDNITREEMLAACEALGKMQTKYGVFFVFGNHDKGYDSPVHRGFTGNDLIEELKKNGVNVLRDEAVLVDNMFYVIGRKDFSEERWQQNGKRLSMGKLVENLDKNKYMLVIDHQPADYENQAKSGVDLVLSGHTHGGQLFPFNQVGKWIKANDLVYGHEKRNNTDFIVTSGISDWAIKFKTGTKSEYVIINLSKE